MGLHNSSHKKKKAHTKKKWRPNHRASSNRQQMMYSVAEGKEMNITQEIKSYREIIKKRQLEYVQLSKTKEKNAVAMKVLREIKSLTPPGRFLTKTKECILWYPQNEESVLLKIKQALRENKKIVKKGCGNDAGTIPTTSLDKVARNKDRTVKKEESTGKALKASSITDVKPLNHVNTSNREMNCYSKEDMDRLISLCKGLNNQEKTGKKKHR